MEFVIRTAQLPPRERFDYWYDAVSGVHGLYEIVSDHSADFRAELHARAFGAVGVSWLTHPSLEARRTAKLIRRHDPEVYHFSLNLSGSVRMAQGRQDVVLEPGDLVLHDSSRPFRSVTHQGLGRASGVTVAFPRTLLPMHPDKVQRLLAVRLPGGSGMGALLSRYLSELATSGHEFRADDSARLSTITLDLIWAMIARGLDAEGSLSPSAQQRVLLVRIHAFIQQRLGDVSLSPDMIAAAHGISTRSLHRLFRDQGVTVTEWIRARRLDRCRRDLADPLLQTRPVHAVAARWGFTNAAHFSRVFRAASGISPAAYRRQCQGLTPPGEDSAQGDHLLNGSPGHASSSS
ncbi:helix-turn-helix domain-containing protein [Streptomyces sp. NPDC005407]|uniref:AraC-like ligand-binding domain-containing protein n=1 Tax=Streptomyces sp. NPDC005407 TaxID=3155340 RepID=UPI0033AF3D26